MRTDFRLIKLKLTDGQAGMLITPTWHALQNRNALRLTSGDLTTTESGEFLLRWDEITLADASMANCCVEKGNSVGRASDS